MKQVKIGLLDEDMRYVEKLSVYLNHMGKGQWRVVSFTEKEQIIKYLNANELDLVIGSEKDFLMDCNKYSENIRVLYLSETAETEHAIPHICRYKRASEIGNQLKNIVVNLNDQKEEKNTMVAIYSPVGRCGKTTFAKQVAEQSVGDKWMYIGIEDYGMLEEGDLTGEEFLYFWIEKNDEKMQSIFHKCNGYIATSFSPFDKKLLDEEHWMWLLKMLEAGKEYRGVIFDIGTGILQRMEWLSKFDQVIVPFIETDTCTNKKRLMFDKLIKDKELFTLLEKVQYLAIDNQEAVKSKMEELWNMR